MMDLMCPADAQQIAIGGFKCFETVVYKPIVKNEIDKAIQANAYTYPKAVI